MDKAARNCANARGLSEEARAVCSYTAAVAGEIKEAEAAKVISLGNMRLYECPLSYMTAETTEVMRLVFLIEDTSALLYGGGWGGQPCWLAEAFEIYRTERGAFQKRLDKNQRA